MALTLNNFCGFETDGLDEAISTTGSPNIQGTIVKNGDFALEFTSGGRFDLPIITGGTSDGSGKYILGLHFRIETNPSPSLSNFVSANEDDGSTIWLIARATDGTFTLRDSNGASIGTFTASNGSWHLLEVIYDHSASGSIILHIDGSEEINASSKDLDSGSTISADDADYRLYDNNADSYFDNVYCYSGATDINDFLGVNVAIERTYQNTVEDATDQGTTLDQGTWAITGDTPLVEDGTPAGYTGAAEDGHTICDEGTRLGPTGGPSLGTIKGAKWLHRLNRGAGSGTTHYKVYGHNGDVTNSDTVTLGTGYGNFFTVKDSSVAQVPTTSESFAQGFRKSSGGREIYCAEIWAFILHVAAAAPAGTGVKNPLLMGRNPLIGPIG